MKDTLHEEQKNVYEVYISTLFSGPEEYTFYPVSSENENQKDTVNYNG